MIFLNFFIKNNLIWPFQLLVHWLFISLHSQLNISVASVRHLLFQSSSLSIIFTLSHKGRWFPFSFHIWSAIPDLYFPSYHCFLMFLLSYFQRTTRLAFVYFTTSPYFLNALFDQQSNFKWFPRLKMPR